MSLTNTLNHIKDFFIFLIKPSYPGNPQNISSGKLFELRVAALQDKDTPTDRTYALANKLSGISSGESGGFSLWGFLFSFFWLAYGLMQPRVIALASIAFFVKIIYLFSFGRNLNTLICIFIIMLITGFLGYRWLWYRTGKRIYDAWVSSDKDFKKAKTALIRQNNMKKPHLYSCFFILLGIELLYVIVTILYNFLLGGNFYFYL
jgi:hypothetical protein